MTQRHGTQRQGGDGAVAQRHLCPTDRGNEGIREECPVSNSPLEPPRTCPAGALAQQSPPACLDIDECTEGIAGESACVGEQTTCTNSHGSYSCSCPSGYRLVDERECVANWEVVATLENVTDVDTQRPGPAGSLNGVIYFGWWATGGEAAFYSFDTATGALTRDAGPSSLLNHPCCWCGGTSNSTLSPFGNRLVSKGGDHAFVTFTPGAATPWERDPFPNAPSVNGGAIASFDGKLHVIGGYAGNSVNEKTHHVFDPDSGTWSSKAELPRGAIGSGAIAVDGSIYFSGYDQAGTMFLRWDADSDTWHEAGAGAFQNSQAMFATGKKLWVPLGYAVGGWNLETSSALPTYTQPFQTRKLATSGEDVYTFGLEGTTLKVLKLKP